MSGKFHSTAHFKAGFELSIPAVNLITTAVPVTTTLAALADRWFSEQQFGLMLTRAGLTLKGELIAREAEAKMTLLADYADELMEDRNGHKRTQ